MIKIAFIVCVMSCTQVLYGQTQPLFKIEQDGKIGYINEKGKVVIKPIFSNGNNFSEGLASVRTNGLYGFIDSAGKYVIEPKYDLATNFVNGLVVVYKNGKPLFINKKEELVLPEVFKGLTFLDKQKGIITTLTNKQGLIDVFSNRLLADTVFESISNFSFGVAVVKEHVSQNQKRREGRFAVIDTNGKFIVPFGKYENINSFNGRYAVVNIIDPKDSDADIIGAIDTKGNLLFKKAYKNSIYFDGDFYDGYAKINLYKYWLPEKTAGGFTSEKNYEGFINLKGEIVLNDTNYQSVNNFSNGRAFVKNEHDDYMLIDKNFKRVSTDTYQYILNDQFQNGFAIVRTNGKYGIIDTMGKYVVKPLYTEIDRVGIVDGFFFFGKEGEDESMLYGIADINGGEITPPIMKEFARRGFENGLLQAVVNNEIVFINKKGQIVWQQQKEGYAVINPLNIDFMNRGYFYAYSGPKKTNAEYNGWGRSSNFPQTTSAKQFPLSTFAVTIDTAIIDTFAKKYTGYKLFISNTTGDLVKFNAQDSRLYLKLQAQNNRGEWKDIEYLPSSWCGNSYHILELESNFFWEFTLPKYEGEFKTRIRAELKIIDSKNPKKEKVVYSNIIDGSINPGQFWNKRAYYSNGIMDPYFD